jgi:hypothetical protein
MTLQDASHLADIATAIATATMSIAAILALLFARRQLRQAEVARHSSEQNSLGAAAVAIYCSLLDKALEYPEFIAPDHSIVDTELETFNGDQKEFRRYEAFVDLMLTTFDAMIQLPTDEVMESYIVQWLSEHRTYLLSDYFSRHFMNGHFGKMVSDKLWLLVEKGAQIEPNIKSHSGQRSLSGATK